MRMGANSLTRSTCSIERPLPGVREKVFTMRIFPPQVAPDSHDDAPFLYGKTPKAGNILKTKDNSSTFLRLPKLGPY